MEPDTYENTPVENVPTENETATVVDPYQDFKDYMLNDVTESRWTAPNEVVVSWVANREPIAVLQGDSLLDRFVQKMLPQIVTSIYSDYVEMERRNYYS